MKTLMAIRRNNPAKGKTGGWRKKEITNRAPTRILAITGASLIKTNQIASPMATKNANRKRYMVSIAQIVLECLRWPSGASVLSKHIAILRMNRRPASVTSRPLELRFTRPSASNGASDASSLAKCCSKLMPSFLRHRGVVEREVAHHAHDGFAADFVLVGEKIRAV